MNTQEGRAWRALAGAKGIGPKTLWLIADYLAGRGQTASWLLENPQEGKSVLGMIKSVSMLPDFHFRESGETEMFAGQQATVLHPLHPDFPQRIRILNERLTLPALLYARGNVAILNRPGAAIVGRRQTGETALALAASLAAELAAQGVNVISGYAAGIDAAAHLGALRAGGTTTVVLAEGIHHFRTKPALKDCLTVDNILVISQFDPDAKWASYLAMERNKLVGALSSVLVVIASGPERDSDGRMSGTFDAGMAALRMGIPVFVAAPDFFADPPAGNRRLIARGGRQWDPRAGAAPILEAVKAISEKNPPGQLSLFAESED